MNKNVFVAVLKLGLLENDIKKLYLPLISSAGYRLDAILATSIIKVWLSFGIKTTWLYFA